MKVLIPVMKFIIPALLELLKWYVANVLQVDLPIWLLSGHKEWKSSFSLSLSLSLSFITNQMCHLAGQEYFYCQWCCFYWPQFQKLLRQKQNKISYSGLFDFSDVDLMKQTLFQGLKSFSPKCPINPMPASLYMNVAVEVLCQEKDFGFCFFAFFFFPIQAATWSRVQFVCLGDISKFIHLFISCYSTSDARQRLVRVEPDAVTCHWYSHRPGAEDLEVLRGCEKCEQNPREGGMEVGEDLLG